jgi:hypothetical protein
MFETFVKTFGYILVDWKRHVPANPHEIQYRARNRIEEDCPASAALDTPFLRPGYSVPHSVAFDCMWRSIRLRVHRGVALSQNTGKLNRQRLRSYRWPPVHPSQREFMRS